MMVGGSELVAGLVTRPPPGIATTGIPVRALKWNVPGVNGGVVVSTQSVVPAAKPPKAPVATATPERGPP